jgi:hypothetical protein
MLVRGRKSKLFRFNRNLHIRVGRTFILLLFLAFPLGLLGFSEAGTPLFSTPHSYFGLMLLFVYGSGAILAFQILKGRQNLIRPHGVLMIIGTFLIFLQLIGGISNLRSLGII